MLRLAADENFNNDVIHGVLHRNPAIDIARVQDAGLSGASDPTVLACAAQEGRVLLTHDLATIPNYAYARIAAEQVMPGVFAVKYETPTRVIIDDILVLVACSGADEWAGQVLYLPL